MLNSFGPRFTKPLLRAIGLRALVPGALLAGLIFSLWQGTQFEIRPTAEPTAFLLADPRPDRNDWPGWRGPRQDGTVTGDFLPLPNESHGWSEHWRCELPAEPASGICVWGDQVFVVGRSRSAAIELICLNRIAGTVEWRTPLAMSAVTDRTKHRPAATPLCDGERVFVPVIADGELWLYAVRMSGQVAWKQSVGPAHGEGLPRNSPTLSGPLVIVTHDQSETALLSGQSSSYLAGLHRQTGQIVYRIERPNGDSDGTPIVADLAGRRQLLVTGRGGVRSYDPDCGNELWFCRWKTARTEGSVACDADHVYAVTGEVDGELICIAADGSCDVTQSHVRWRERRPGQRLLSPTMTADGLIVLTRDGMLTAINPATGKPSWQRRSLGSCSVPPLRIADDAVSILTEGGRVVVLNTSRRGDVLWEGLLGHPVTVPPAIAHGRVLLQSGRRVLSIGGATPDTLVQQPPVTAKPL